MSLKEFSSSINKIINERLTSPFYGTFIAAWLIINWKIIYFTVFVDSDEIEGNKLDFIIQNYLEVANTIWLPLLATVLLITIFPFITYLAYWANLYFSSLRKKKKNQVEKNQLLTLEESSLIKIEIQNQKIRFNELLVDRDERIKELENQVEILSSKNIVTEPEINSSITNESTLDIIRKDTEEENLNNLFDKLLDDVDLIKDLENIIFGIEQYNSASYNANTNSVGKLRANGIIERNEQRKDYLTDVGKKFLKHYYNSDF